MITPQPPSPVEPSTGERVLAAAENLFGIRGFHGTHLRELAAVVGIQKASLFHHFPSKEELYRAVLRRSAIDLEGALAPALEGGAPFRHRLRRLISTYVDLVAQRPARTQILLRELLETLPPGNHRIPPELQPVLASVAGFIHEGQRAGAFRAVDLAALTLSLIGIAAFFVSAAPTVSPGWVTELTARGEATATVKECLIEIVERILLDPSSSQPPSSEARPDGAA